MEFEKKGMKGPFTNKKTYLRDCAKLTVERNLTLDYWNSKQVQERERRLQSGFVVRVNNKAIKEELHRAYLHMLTVIGGKLRSRLFAMKFDMATRKDRHILGIPRWNMTN